MASMFPVLLLVTCFLCACLGLDNGLAQTPPLGWISSERFRCNTDCENYPDDCISERLVKSTAQAMSRGGFRDAGYNYLILDDCWQAKSRDKEGNLQVDPERFPSGMKGLAEYVHTLNLHLGLYLNTQNTTCNGFPGSQGHMTQDSQTLTRWGVDMVKVDSCGVQHTSVLDQVYAEFQQDFNKTGRPVLFMCTYPLYQRGHGIDRDYKKITSTCNIFKESDDMNDSWIDLEKTIKYFGDIGHGLVNVSRPGSWSYANPVLVGDYGLSPDQQRMQVALWSMMASPLLVSADLRQKRTEFHELLLNPRVIAISQDPLGIMGSQVFVNGQQYMWMKPILPKGSFAIAIYYVNISGGPSKFSKKLQDVGMVTAAAYNFTDVFTGRFIGVYKPWYTFDAEINPTGVLFINATALP